MAEADEIVTARLEQEFAYLARALEANNRRRNYPLERAHYLLLLQLEAEPKSVGALAERLVLDNSTVTRQIAAMEKRGLVKRIANPADRRSALVERTARGAKEVGEMQAERRERIAALFAQWPEGDREQLAGMLGRVNALLAARLAEGGSD